MDTVEQISEQIAASERPTTMVKGSVHTITFKNDESGFAILRLQVDEEFAHASFVSRANRICTIKGPLNKITVGEKIQVWGIIKPNKKYGPSLEVERVIVSEPKELTEIAKYLHSNVHLIGKKFAADIVAKFGYETIQIIDETPDRLREVAGIGDKRLEEIKKIWQEQREFRKLLMFCTQIGLSGNVLTKIHKKYRERAVEKIKEDPYRLSRDIWGIGFKKADEVAKHLGIEETSTIRIRAALEFQIDQRASLHGDCFCYAPELLQQTVQFLDMPEHITPEVVKRVILESVQQGYLVAEGNRLYLPEISIAENNTARSLAAIAKSPLPSKLKGDGLRALVDSAIKSVPFELAPSQRDAVARTLASKVSVITGGPGTGKTTITQCVVNAYLQAGMMVRLMAPTGRAAKRMSEVIGIGASTVHKVLFTLDKAVKEGMTVEEVTMHGVIVIDEWSMGDIKLMDWLLKYVGQDAILVIIGDKDQLPSVGPGAVLRDMIECNVIAVSHLTQIFRQAQGSNICVAAERVNNGHMPMMYLLGREHGIPKNTDIFTVIKEDATQQAKAAVWCATTLARSLGFDPAKDCQVLSPMHKGDSGVQALNGLLQQALNPTPVASVDRGLGIRWGVGDKVMQTKNNYELGVLNGDIGIITDIAHDVDGKLSWLVVDFEGESVKYEEAEDWMDLQLSYACTVHKMQGSEFPMIILVLHTSAYMMLQRNLVYTGMTRGKKVVVLVVNPTALAMAVQNNKVSRRNTFLSEKIRLEMAA
jgi:exodeoxyribonuclease V alpha subunit